MLPKRPSDHSSHTPPPTQHLLCDGILTDSISQLIQAVTLPPSSTFPTSLFGDQNPIEKTSQSEYLSGFVGVNDGDEEHLGYGALGSGGEEEDEEEEGCGEDTTGRPATDACRSSDASAAAAAEIGAEGKSRGPRGGGESVGGCIPASEDINQRGRGGAGGWRNQPGHGDERRGEDGVDPAHIEVSL